MSKALLVSIALCAAAVTGCSSWGKGETVGTVGGAAAGGAIGSAATGGSTAGTVGGAVLGGAVGNHVGDKYDQNHK
jgi:osmotically inducible lipoprotein OsmB